MISCFLACFLWAQSVPATGLRTCVVVSGESGVPVSGVLAYTDTEAHDSSRWDGTVCVPDSFSLLTLKHPKFETRRLRPDELQDTLFLIPKMNAVAEVMVWGNRRWKSDRFRPDVVDMQLQQRVGGDVSVLGPLLWAYDKLWGERKRHRAALKKQKYQQMMDNY